MSHFKTAQPKPPLVRKERLSLLTLQGTKSMTVADSTKPSVIRHQIDEAIDKKVTPQFASVNKRLDGLALGQRELTEKLDLVLAALNTGFNSLKP